MHLTLVGLSHKTAPVEIREKLTFPADVQPHALATLVDYHAVNECLIVSTCNRTEIYAVTSEDADGVGTIVDFMATYHDLDRTELRKYLYAKQGEDVITHLFRVVSSLDSMVLGEAQILHQVKEAYDHAFDAGTTGRILNELFRRSFTVGKRVRTETEIGENAVSISYAAIELAKRVFDTLEGRTVLVLGAGKMSELTAKHLQANGVAKTIVANRTLSRAEELAAKFDGIAIPFENRYNYLREADIVVSATSAEGYVLTKEDLIPAATKRPDPLFLIDIAVPRDIEPACADLSQVYVYDVDALDGIVAANLEERMHEAERAEVIIDEEIASFEHWLESMEVAPTIAAIRAKAEAMRAEEMQKAYRRLGGLSDKELQCIDKLTQAIVNKMLHEPTAALRDASGGKRGVAMVETARIMYGLDDGEKGEETGFRLIRSLLGRRPASASQSDALEIGDNL